MYRGNPSEIFSDDFLELIDDAHEFEQSGKFDEWLKSIPADSDMSDRISNMGF